MGWNTGPGRSDLSGGVGDQQTVSSRKCTQGDFRKGNAGRLRGKGPPRWGGPFPRLRPGKDVSRGAEGSAAFSAKRQEEPLRSAPRGNDLDPFRLAAGGGRSGRERAAAAAGRNRRAVSSADIILMGE